jgi:DNA polymerase-4
VRTATGLSCSIGVAPNKLLAKIGSDLDKPGGITVLTMDDVPTRIWPMATRKINGIGPKASDKLAGLGIRTIGELAQQTQAFLLQHFGRSYGEWLYQAARGLDERPVVTRSEPKSISRETTFERDLHVRTDRARLSEIFTALCQRVAGDLQRKGYVGKTIGIKLRYDDFKTLTRDLTLPVATDDPAEIRRAAGECLRRVPLDKRLRLLGVRVSALQKKGDAEPASSPQAELTLD